VKRSMQLEVVLVAVVAAAVATTFAPWGTSGTVGRSSYELVDAARALDLLDDGLVRFAPAWFTLPFLAAGVVIAVGWGKPRLAAGLAVCVGSVMVLGWMSVKSSPVGVDTGAVAGAVLGGATVAVAGMLLIREGSTRRDQ